MVVRTKVSGNSGFFRVLLVEDDGPLALETTRYLEANGLLVTNAAEGRQGLVEAFAGGHDVVVLDATLPDLTGIETCRTVRARSGVPILMLSTRFEELDRIRALDAGADLVLPKPFSLRELLAHLHALVRRWRGTVGPPEELIHLGDLVLSTRNYWATLAGQSLQLTTAEFLLLRVLVERPGRILSREQLLDLTRGNAGEAFGRSIDAHVSRLRRKLGDDARKPRLLRTIRGSGYLLAAERLGALPATAAGSGSIQPAGESRESIGNERWMPS